MEKKRIAEGLLLLFFFVSFLFSYFCELLPLKTSYWNVLRKVKYFCLLIYHFFQDYNIIWNFKNIHQVVKSKHGCVNCNSASCRNRVIRVWKLPRNYVVYEYLHRKHVFILQLASKPLYFWSIIHENPWRTKMLDEAIVWKQYDGNQYIWSKTRYNQSNKHQHHFIISSNLEMKVLQMKSA